MKHNVELERHSPAADQQQVKIMLDYYRRIMGPFPPHIAEIAAEWERVERR